MTKMTEKIVKPMFLLLLCSLFVAGFVACSKKDKDDAKSDVLSDADSTGQDAVEQEGGVQKNENDEKATLEDKAVDTKFAAKDGDLGEEPAGASERMKEAIRKGPRAGRNMRENFAKGGLKDSSLNVERENRGKRRSNRPRPNAAAGEAGEAVEGEGESAALEGPLGERALNAGRRRGRQGRGEAAVGAEGASLGSEGSGAARQAGQVGDAGQVGSRRSQRTASGSEPAGRAGERPASARASNRTVGGTAQAEKTLPYATVVELTENKDLRPEGALPGLRAEAGYSSFMYAPTSGKGFGVGIQIWQATVRRDADDRYRRMRLQYPKASDIGQLAPSQAFYSYFADLHSLTFLDNQKRVVVTLTCSENTCDQKQLLKLAKAARERL